MDIDESGREHPSVCLNDLIARVTGELPDRADKAGIDGDICRLRIGAAPIKYARIPDNCVATGHTEW
jgi:hypothetical protein